jgi:hypothetical protein
MFIRLFADLLPLFSFAGYIWAQVGRGKDLLPEQYDSKQYSSR